MSLKFLIPDWPAPKNVEALTTFRDTDVETLPQIPQAPTWLKQVHGTKVICVDNLAMQRPEADAAVAFNATTVCAVETADCLPILICDKQGTQVAAIHAGWRGLAAGIISNTLQQFAAPLPQCMVWLGPAIGPTAFEVSSDVVEKFLAYGWDPKQIQSGFTPKSDVESKWLGNLPLLARLTLQQHGILADNIYGGDLCTYSDPARFYSYRRSGDLGRLCSLIWFK